MSLFLHESKETDVDFPLICAQSAVLEKFWLHITKLVETRRVKRSTRAFLWCTLDLKYRSVQGSERRGFAVKPTAKYLDECLDLVHSQNAKLVVMPLSEQKSANLHDETTVCDQAEHALFRAVIGKLHYILERDRIFYS